MKKSKKNVKKIVPAYACMAATLASMISQGLMTPMTIHAATGDGQADETKNENENQMKLTFAEKSSVTVDIANIYQQFAEDSGIVSEVNVADADRTITITKDGTYTFTGSNYINEAYIDTRICIKSGVTANLICENLEIRNVDMFYGSGAEAKDYYNPICVEENAVLNLLGDGSFCHSVSRNDGEGKIRSITGGGKVEIYEGNFVFDTDTDVSEAVVHTGNIYGEGSFSDADSSIRDTEGNVLSKYTFDTISKDTLIEEMFYGAGDSCMYMTPEYTATDADAQLHLYLNSDNTDTVEFVTDGGMVYAYTWSKEEQNYVESMPKYNEVCTVTYVEEDGTELCKSYCQKGGSVVLPSFGERDVLFTQGEHAFDGTMILKDETVMVKDTVLELNVSIDGKAFIYKKDITKLPEHHYYVDEANQKCYKGGDVLKESCTLKSIAYTVVDEKEVISIDSDASMETYVLFSEYAEAQDMDVELLADVSLDTVLFADGEMPFKGVFDGKGHTLTVDIERREGYAAPFGCLGGTVKNLVIDGTIQTKAYYIGGVAASAIGGSSILNCNSAVDIDFSSSGYVGGIVGCVGSDESVYIEDCAFTGSMTGDGRSNTSGIIGSCYGEAEIKDSFVDAKMAVEAYEIYTLAAKEYADEFTAENCYFVQKFPEETEVTEGSEAISSIAVINGELCYRLNGSDSEDVTWHQKIGADEVPMPFVKEGGVVYQVTGCKEETLAYSNVNEKLDTHMYAPVFAWKEEPDENGDYDADVSIKYAFCDAPAEETEALEVQITKEIKNPTCEENGEAIFAASVMYEGKTYTDEKRTVIPAEGIEHVYENIVLEDGSNLCSEANCEMPAQYYPVCTNCRELDLYEVFSHGETAGHKEEISVIAFEKAEDGYTANAYLACEDCHELIKVQPVEVKKEITEQAGCLKNGKAVYTAAITIGDVEYTKTKEVILAKSGHVSAEEAEKENCIEASCTQDGSHDEVWYCTGCHLELSRENVKDEAAGHKLKDIPAAESTCEVSGNIEYWQCETCEKVFADAEGTKELEKTQTELPLADHTPKAAVKENEIAATTAATGSYEEVVYCEKCGEELSRETKITDMLPSNNQGGTPGGSQNTTEPNGTPDGSQSTTEPNETPDGSQNTKNPEEISYSTMIVKSGCIYKIINEKKKEAEIVGLADTKKKTVTIPATVKLEGKKYKVTSIGAKAFHNNKKVTKIVIGKNVKKIGKEAFKNCTEMKNMVFKTKQLKAKNIGKNAFKGMGSKYYKKVVVKVPAKKLKSYKKVFKAKGMSKKIKVK
ncbi:MAG: leucine-rich repeat protein [Lachnospiraceae bacterium]|nr:leucine-rich repeat protein [Lachnospiraceae bacterium]